MGVEPLPSERETIRPLPSILDRLNRSMGLARPDSVRLLQDGWSSLIGSRLAAVADLESLHDGVLTIAVSDPAVAEHLRWQSADLAAAADAMCGGDTVGRVVVRVRAALS